MTHWNVCKAENPTSLAAVDEIHCLLSAVKVNPPPLLAEINSPRALTGVLRIFRRRAAY
jgi:hypothetical protein